VREPLDRAAALLARCSLVVGVDTGLLHIAAAVGTRYVGLFGPTNPLVTGPYDRSLGTTLVAPFAKQRACGGCWRQFKYIDDRCAALAHGSCMHALPLEPVLEACAAELVKHRSSAVDARDRLELVEVAA
jgi:ADP-heptose:LPS heptosyltransferase